MAVLVSVAPKRVITWWRLAAIAFVSVAGGGFGIGPYRAPC
jgi:hypothetical protein